MYTTLLTPFNLVLYTTYLNIGVDGLQALEHYNFHNKAWGQVHHQVRLTYLCPFPLHYIYEGTLLTRKKKKKKLTPSPGPLLHPQTPSPRRRRRHSHLARPYHLHPHRPHRPHQDPLSRQTGSGPLPLPSAHLALHRRRFLLQAVLRPHVCGGRRVRAVASDCLFQAQSKMEVRAAKYFHQGG